jgi:hypothetical protein
MATTWKCPKCKRSFARKGQRHACGTGKRNDILRNRPDSIVRIYESIESFAKSLGPVEFVTRERYALLRSIRIFADLVVMTDAIRIAIHLGRKSDDPIFFKVVSDRKKVTHVAKLQSQGEFRAIKPYLKEAYKSSLR